MKYKTSIILGLFILTITSVKSQEDDFWNYKKKSLVDTILLDMEQARSTINKNLIVLDSLFNSEEIDNSDFLSIGKFILTSCIQVINATEESRLIF